MPMNTLSKISLAIVASVALGAAAIQGLHAQAKPKAYTVTELEVIDAAANAAFVPLVQAAQKAAGARPFRTGGGRIVAMEGAAPSRVVIAEWDSLEQAEAFYKSKAWTDLAPQRDKAIKTIRRYAVEALNLVTPNFSSVTAMLGRRSLRNVPFVESATSAGVTLPPRVPIKAGSRNPCQIPTSRLRSTH